MLSSCLRREAREIVRSYGSSVWKEAVPNAILAVGANIGERLQTIRQAIRQFPSHGIEVARFSRLYESEAAYVTDQPNFLNAALAVQTRLPPHDLLKSLKALEAAAGRNFGGQRFGPRPLDLDIIAYGPTLSDAVADNSLKIPHARWHERDFVKAPITDLYSLTEIHGMGLDSSNILARAHETWDLLGGESQLGSSALRCVLPLGLNQILYPWQARTRVMGILNLTPDSFSDGVQSDISAQDAVLRARQMVEDGADIIDVGGQSTRPGADFLPAKDEAARVLPSIRAMKEDRILCQVPLSVDTFHSSVAREAVHAGADIVNDVSGGKIDPDMLATVGDLGVTYIMMHMRGNPRSMQSSELTQYPPNEVAATVGSELSEQTQKAIRAGIEPWRLVLDPGIGFAKTGSGQCELLRDLGIFVKSLPGCLQKQPVLTGSSRKGFLGKITGIQDPKKRDLASAVAASLSIARGAHIIRVHDVKSGSQAAKVSDSILMGKIL